jgi:hypothetical protein
MATIPTSKKPILCLDFDGVIHRYSKGWMDGSIYDPVTEGFWPWVIRATRTFDARIFSSRFTTENQAKEGYLYLQKEFMQWSQRQTTHPGVDAFHQIGLTISLTKPPAFVTIDDRALTFTGDWEDFPALQVLEFKTWSQNPYIPYAYASLLNAATGAVEEGPVDEL